MALLLACPAAAQTSWRFDFGEGAPAAGFRKVTITDTFSTIPGYGFEKGQPLVAQTTGKRSTASGDFITSSTPFCFSVVLPQGNYQVKVVSGDAAGTSDVCIKAECRRFMVQRAVTARGTFVTSPFTVHVRDSTLPGNRVVRLKPREKYYRHWDNRLTLEFNGPQPKICSVEITPARQIPTVFLAGNSTVTDQPTEPWAAWGQLLPLFFRPGKVAVANYAESGETLLAFRREQRLEKIWSLARPGDYLFIEFAHNDQKPGGNHLDPFTTYQQVLGEWIAECRAHQVTPVLVTSMHRRDFDSAGHIRNTLGDYPEAMRQAGKAAGVVVLDLNACSKTLYEAWGEQASEKAFVHFPANTFPDQPQALKDNTHFSTYGAYELCKCVVQAIRTSTLPLKKYIVAGFNGFNPAKPDAISQVYLPASPLGMATKPDGN